VTPLHEDFPVTLTWIRTHDWDASAWRRDALCRSSNPDLFFPIGATGLAADQIEAAKEICGICPVAEACLEFAMETNQEAGVWGGLTEDERRALKRAPAAAAV
jgi:WhiB family redox-sensing transcriptional regulator